jgi:hypothetical protein
MREPVLAHILSPPLEIVRMYRFAAMRLIGIDPAGSVIAIDREHRFDILIH